MLALLLHPNFSCCQLLLRKHGAFCYSGNVPLPSWGHDLSGVFHWLFLPLEAHQCSMLLAPSYPAVLPTLCSLTDSFLFFLSVSAHWGFGAGRTGTEAASGIQSRATHWCHVHRELKEGCSAHGQRGARAWHGCLGIQRENKQKGTAHPNNHPHQGEQGWPRAWLRSKSHGIWFEKAGRSRDKAPQSALTQGGSLLVFMERSATSGCVHGCRFA